MSQKKDPVGNGVCVFLRESPPQHDSKEKHMEDDNRKGIGHRKTKQNNYDTNNLQPKWMLKMVQVLFLLEETWKSNHFTVSHVEPEFYVILTFPKKHMHLKNPGCRIPVSISTPNSRF